MDGCLPKAGNVARQVIAALEAKRKSPGPLLRPDVSLMCETQGAPKRPAPRTIH